MLYASSSESPYHSPTSFHVLFYDPLCKNHYKSAGNKPSDDLTQHRKPNVYCRSSDRSRNRPHPLSKLVATVNSAHPIREAHILTFTIGDQDFISAVCGRMSTETRRVRVYSQLGLSKYGTNKIAECADNAGVADIDHGFRGRSGDFDSFHSKLILFEYTDDTATIVSSSGNPTTGSELYFDFVVSRFYQSHKHPSVRWHKCVSSLFSNKKYHDSYNELRNKYRNCRNRVSNRFVSAERAYLLPFDRQDFLLEFSYYLGQSRAVKILTQRANSYVFRDLLLRALEDGVALQIIRDDDLYWASKERASEYELMNDRSEFTNWLEPLLQAGAEVRYLQTNHHGPRAKNFLHAKAVIFEMSDGSHVVYHGAANLTRAALYRNFENVYFTHDRRVTGAFASAFGRYWRTLATPEEFMPNEDLPPK